MQELKAIEKAESAPIAERKQALLGKAMRIANKAADRIEDQIDGANITQATVAFGVTVDKINLLSGDPTIHIQHSIEHSDGNPNWLYDRINELAARLSQPRTHRRRRRSTADRSTSIAKRRNNFGFGALRSV